MKDVIIIIPAYKPDNHLLSTIKSLNEKDFNEIIIVDDGSGDEYKNIFLEVKKNENCTLLTHPVNMGKGAALKTAFKFVIDNRPNCIGVVTADADGQHLAEDIYNTAYRMKEKNSVILGVRDFSNSDVPFKSKFGNKITIAVFKLFFGLKLSDTQTGLRAIPKKYLADLLTISGQRYEFETHMLCMMSKNNTPIEEVGIKTVYIEENKASHFRAVKDSILIYGLILKYLLSSVSAAIIDETAFYFLKLLFILTNFTFIIPSTIVAAFIARVISSLINFYINAKVVFKDKVSKSCLIKYYILAIIQITISGGLVFLLENVFSVETALLSTVLKTIVDIILFFFSFRIQHKWVFNSKTIGENNEQK